MKKESTVLILGAGQVGTQVAIQCLEGGAERVVLHCLTADESDQAAETVRREIASANVKTSFGNILLPLNLVNQTAVTERQKEWRLLKHLFGELTPELISNSFLYQLVSQIRPTYIVDAVNIATAVGYRLDFFEAVRNALSRKRPLTRNINAIALSSPVPPLVRLVQVLQAAMKEFNVVQYVKVSTTGLGGMGFNIQYTHGDLGEPGLSTKLLGKVSAAGILLQLLSTLRHTPGFKVNVVVPAALIGWGEVAQRNIVSDCPLVDCNPISVTGQSLTAPLGSLAQIRTFEGKTIPCVVVDSGENGAYALHDMAAITALGQMGCVTKEEVAQAVLSILEGDETCCVLAAMDQALMEDSGNGRTVRRQILDEMRQKITESGIPSPSVLRLGPRIAKLLWELEVISRVCSSLRQAAELDSSNLSGLCQQFIGDSEIHRQMLLSLNIPIITDEFVYLSSAESVTLADLYKRAGTQCVDLRQDNILSWQEAFRHIVNSINLGEIPRCCNVSDIVPDDPINPGELLGFWFTLSGGGKKSEA